MGNEASRYEQPRKQPEHLAEEIKFIAGQAVLHDAVNRIKRNNERPSTATTWKNEGASSLRAR